MGRIWGQVEAEAPEEVEEVGRKSRIPVPIRNRMELPTPGHKGSQAGAGTTNCSELCLVGTGFEGFDGTKDGKECPRFWGHVFWVGFLCSGASHHQFVPEHSKGEPESSSETVSGQVRAWDVPSVDL